MEKLSLLFDYDVHACILFIDVKTNSCSWFELHKTFHNSSLSRNFVYFFHIIDPIRYFLKSKQIQTSFSCNVNQWGVEIFTNWKFITHSLWLIFDMKISYHTSLGVAPNLMICIKIKSCLQNVAEISGCLYHFS